MKRPRNWHVPENVLRIAKVLYDPFGRRRDPWENLSRSDQVVYLNRADAVAKITGTVADQKRDEAFNEMLAALKALLGMSEEAVGMRYSERIRMAEDAIKKAEPLR